MGAAGKRVFLAVHAEITDRSGERQVFCTKAEGRYQEKAGKHYFRYEDDVVGERSRVVLKVDGKDVTLIRRGVRSNLSYTQHFSEGKVHDAMYETPHGRIPISVATERTLIRLTNGAGSIELAYTVAFTGALETHNVLQIEVTDVDRSH